MKPVDVIANCGGRTFVMTIGNGIVCTWMLYLGKLDATSYTAIIIATVGAFIGANAVQGRADTFAERDRDIARAQTEALK